MKFSQLAMPACVFIAEVNGVDAPSSDKLKKTNSLFENITPVLIYQLYHKKSDSPDQQHAHLRSCGASSIDIANIHIDDDRVMEQISVWMEKNKGQKCKLEYPRLLLIGDIHDHPRYGSIHSKLVEITSDPSHNTAAFIEGLTDQGATSFHSGIKALDSLTLKRVAMVNTCKHFGELYGLSVCILSLAFEMTHDKSMIDVAEISKSSLVFAEKLVNFYNTELSTFVDLNRPTQNKNDLKLAVTQFLQSHPRWFKHLEPLVNTCASKLIEVVNGDQDITLNDEQRASLLSALTQYVEKFDPNLSNKYQEDLNFNPRDVEAYNRVISFIKDNPDIKNIIIFVGSSHVSILSELFKKFEI